MSKCLFDPSAPPPARHQGLQDSRAQGMLQEGGWRNPGPCRAGIPVLPALPPSSSHLAPQQSKPCSRGAVVGWPSPLSCLPSITKSWPWNGFCPLWLWGTKKWQQWHCKGHREGSWLGTPRGARSQALEGLELQETVAFLYWERRFCVFCNRYTVLLSRDI